MLLHLGVLLGGRFVRHAIEWCGVLWVENPLTFRRFFFWSRTNLYFLMCVCVCVFPYSFVWFREW